MVRSLRDTQPALWNEIKRMAGLITSTRQRVTTLEDNFKEPTWGDIRGTLASQTDLQTALNNGGSGGGATQVFVQDTQPAMASGEPWIWWQTVGGEVSDYYVFDGVV